MAELLRCAIYTRKSTEEGLEQEFNSLHAQREACEAYTLAHRHEGWKTLATAYDDGGWSGGNMERPALKALLADVQAGLIDVVIVYKVDRLSRSLVDFVKIIELLDGKDVSFVSVTQAFNTTSSMGRLTLNVLLSFAQFEREVTSERIRDKIAASKKKGMWMGGYVPLGYDWTERKLQINPAEAGRVRELFAAYLRLPGVDAVCAWAKEAGIVSKRRQQRNGEWIGGGPICRGALYDILRNPIYVGDIAHRGERHRGQHQPILDEELFQKVQERLAERQADRRFGRRTADPNLFTGLLFDEDGARYGPAATTKGSRRYRYYVGDGEGDQKRLPAHDLEQQVLKQVCTFLRDPAALLAELAGNDAAAGQATLQRAAGLADELGQFKGIALHRLVQKLIARVVLTDSGSSTHLRKALLDPQEGGEANVVVIGAFKLARRGGHLIHVAAPQGKPIRPVDPVLMRLLAKAEIWFEQLSGGTGLTMKDLAAAEGVTDMWVSQVVELAFLAPDLKRQILEGRQPVWLTATKLKKLCPLPVAWQEQRSRWTAAQP